MRRKRDKVYEYEAIVRIDGMSKRMSAAELANRCRKECINPKQLKILCSGENLSGDSCTCRLDLCSWKDNNEVNPYFAHRDRDKTVHIEGCDAACDVITYRINHSADLTFANSNSEELFSLICSKTSKDKPKKEPDDTDDSEDNGDIDIKPNTDVPTDVEVISEYVPIKSVADLYISVVSALRHSTKELDSNGKKPEDLIINVDTIKKYSTEKTIDA